MNKKSIGFAIQQSTGISQKQIDLVLTEFVSEVSNALQRGECVRIDRFGTLTPRLRKESMRVNPTNQQPVLSKEKMNVKFKASVALDRQINEGR